MANLVNPRIPIARRARVLVNLMGDRLATLPLLVLYLTDGCNSRCVMCDIWKSPRRNMSLDLVEHLADEGARLGVRWVLLSGGEAMQHPEWPRIAMRFRSEGIRVLLLTNGLLLKRQMDAVIETIDELVVSMDAGTPETYQQIRGVDAFDLVWEGISLARQANIPVITRTTVQRANFREIEAIILKGLEADVTSISFLAVDLANPFAFGDRFSKKSLSDTSISLVTSGQLSAGSSALSLEEVNELEDILERLPSRFGQAFAEQRIAESPEKLRRMLLLYFQALLGLVEYPVPLCNAPHFSTVVEVDGALRPCYFLPSYGQAIPQESPLSRSLNTDEALSLRRAYRSGQRAECRSCVCPLYKGPRQLIGM